MKAIKRSIKRRRLLLLFWSAILLSSVLIVGQAFSASTPYLATETSGTTMQEGTYSGPDVCGACHTEQHDAWEGSVHDLAWNASTHITPDRNCWTCHVNGTNFETGQFIGEDLYGFTATNTPVVDGVSCETCHGPYQGGAGPGHMPVTYAAELCGECHSPYHSDHGNFYERWAMSGHAEAHTTLIESGSEVPRCIHCMSAEGALPWPLGGVDTFAEMENGITCAVCHDPHSDEHEYKLREASVYELCVVCHSHETETNPHFGRLDPEGNEATCATCHMYGRDWSTRLEAWRLNTNHTMGVWIEACGQVAPDENVTTCHANPEAAWARMEEFVARGEERTAETEALAEEAFAAFETANTTAGVNPALLAEATDVYEALDTTMGEVGHAGSSAFHDPFYLEDLLDEASAEAMELKNLSERAMEPGMTVTRTTTVVSENGLLILAVLGLGITLLVAGLRRRRAT